MSFVALTLPSSLVNSGAGSELPKEVLTPREKQVLLGFIQPGSTHDQVATSLCISRSTLDKHLDQIYEKLGVKRLHNVLLWFVVKYREDSAVRTALEGLNAA